MIVNYTEKGKHEQPATSPLPPGAVGSVGGNAGRRLGSELCLPSSGVGGSPRARQPRGGTDVGLELTRWPGPHVPAFHGAFVVTIRRVRWLPCPSPGCTVVLGPVRGGPWSPTPGRGHKPVAMVTTTWPSTIAVPWERPVRLPGSHGGPCRGAACAFALWRLRQLRLRLRRWPRAGCHCVVPTDNPGLGGTHISCVFCQ